MLELTEICVRQGLVLLKPRGLSVLQGAGLAEEWERLRHSPLVG